MAGVYWIASYPKSGNTWLRFLACNLVFGPVESAEALNQFAPDVHELHPAFELPARPLLMKTHLTCSPIARFADRTIAGIYVLRDPADVLVSNFHYSLRSGADSVDIDAAFDRYFDAFVAARGDPRWVRMGMGTWEENVRSWSDERAPFRVHVIRYEDMQSDCVATATALCGALGITRSPEVIAAAVEQSSFDSLRKLEEGDIRARRAGIFYKPYLQGSIDAGHRFMRCGQRGAAQQKLSAQQWQRFDAVFGRLRREHGYC